MKKFVIIFAVLLMIAGAAVSIMKTMELGPFAPEGENGEEGSADSEDAPKKAKLEPPRFVDMEPLVIPFIQGTKVSTTIQITLKLEAMGAENEAKIMKLLPRLSDAFLRDLYSYVPRLLSKRARVDVFVIKRRLQMVSDRVAGPGTIDGSPGPIGDRCVASARALGKAEKMIATAPTGL